MKRFFYLLFVLPLFMVSCSDDNDVPNVNVYAEFSGGTRVDDVIYVVQGDTFSIDGINIESLDKKSALIGGATYYWDYMRIGTTIEAPYSMEINTADLPVGNHLLQVEISIYAVDYSPCMGYMAYKIKIVPSADDIPSAANPDAPDANRLRADIRVNDK